MLGKFLTKETCASCKFCCSFKRTSLWETPTFSETKFQELSNNYMFSMKKISQTHYTLALENQYKTKDENEEATCFFLDKNKGCTLSQKDKPFDCKIWPFRVMTENNKVFIAIATGCPKYEIFFTDEARSYFNSVIKPEIIKNLKANPSMIKKFNNNYKKYSEC